MRVCVRARAFVQTYLCAYLSASLNVHVKFNCKVCNKLLPSSFGFQVLGLRTYLQPIACCGEEGRRLVLRETRSYYHTVPAADARGDLHVAGILVLGLVRFRTAFARGRLHAR